LPVDNSNFNIATYTYTTQNLLAVGSTHTLTINAGPSGVKDSNGNSLEVAVTQDFTIKPAPPLIVNILNGNTNIEIANFTLIFNRAINVASLDGAIKLKQIPTAITPNPIAVPVSVKYNSETNSTIINSTTALTVGEAYILSIDSGLIDLNGTTLTSVVEHNFTVEQHAWSNYELIANRGIYTGLSTSAVFERGHNNGLTVVWNDNKKIYQRFYDPITKNWSAISYPAGNIDLQLNVRFDQIKTTLDINNNAFTSWVTIEINPSTKQENTTVWVNRYSNGSWAVQKNFISTVTTIPLYDLAVSSNGDAFMAWRIIITPTPQNQNRSQVIRYSNYKNGGSWSATKNLQTVINLNNAIINVSLDGVGNGFVFWDSYEFLTPPQNFPIYSNRIFEGVVSTHTKIIPVRNYGGDILVKSDKTGNTLLAWYDYTINSVNGDQTESLYSMRFTGNWSTPYVHESILRGNGPSAITETSPSLVMNDNGNAVLTWRISNYDPVTKAFLSYSNKANYFDSNFWGSAQEFINASNILGINKSIMSSTGKSLLLLDSYVNQGSSVTKWITYNYSKTLKKWELAFNIIPGTNMVQFNESDELVGVLDREVIDIDLSNPLSPVRHEIIEFLKFK